jgi:hypothetical protein
VKGLNFFVCTNFIFLAISCATTDTIRKVEAESKYYIIPEIGIETTAFIGENLIKEGRMLAHDAIFLSFDHGTKGWTVFHPAGEYKLIGRNDSYFIYRHGMLQPTHWGNVYPQIVEEPEGKVYLQTNTSQQLLEPTEYTKRRQFIEELDNAFEQTLIYTGAEGTALKFTYREFSNNVARPAFTVDATYDIKNGNIIRFKGALLEIIRTDNCKLRPPRAKSPAN